MTDPTERGPEETYRNPNEDEVESHSRRRTEDDAPAKDSVEGRRPARGSDDVAEDVEGHSRRLNESPAPGLNDENEDDDEGRAISDRALKHSIEPLGGALDAILSLARKEGLSV